MPQWWAYLTTVSLNDQIVGPNYCQSQVAGSLVKIFNTEIRDSKSGLILMLENKHTSIHLGGGGASAKKWVSLFSPL